MTATRIAITGLGKIALDQHVPAITGNSDFELVAIVSGRGAPVNGLPSFPDLGTLLAALPEVEAVALCTPPTGRLALAITALRAGKHVLLEKPPSATLAEADVLAAVAAETGQVVFATWHSRFNPAVEEARRLLKGRRLRRLHIDWREDVRRWHPGQAWIWQPGGFGVFDPGINALSIATAITPSPLHVSASRLEIAGNHQTPIGAELTFDTPDALPGSRLTAVFDWRKEGEQSWTIEAETESGVHLTLTEGGRCLAVDGVPTIEAPSREYPAIYERFAALLAAGASDYDLRPLQLVADAFLLGERRGVADFDAG
jgi:D-galactose 1-dehydrogenase